MNEKNEMFLTEEEMENLITELTKELPMLRTKADLSQEEVAILIGVSRQTYGAIERKTRKMSWNTYLSLILFYDYNRKTHNTLRTIDAFPHEIIKRFNEGCDPLALDIDDFIADGIKGIADKLDDQALRQIRTLIMLEYARCSGTPGDVVVKAFGGMTFPDSVQPDDEKVIKSLRAIKESRKKDGE